MITLDQARTLQGKTMHGASGKLGKIDTLYADREDGEPTFATVHTGHFGGKTSFVPLAQATLEGEDVRVPYDEEQVKAAPSIEQDAELSPEEEQRLYQHYGVGGQSGTTTPTDQTYVGGTGGTGGTSGYDASKDRDNDGVDADGDARGTVGRDTSGPTTDDAMTRSEERLTVGTHQAETGRARLRKFIVTENVTQTVPVSHEEVRIEREPITDANRGAAGAGPDLSEEEHEVTLHSEEVVVNKETVPVERVRLGKETVTEQQQVSETVRKEQIETDDVYPKGDESRTDASRTETTRTETGGTDR